MSVSKFIPMNDDWVKIVRFFLEKYELLTVDERKILSEAIALGQKPFVFCNYGDN